MKLDISSSSSFVKFSELKSGDAFRYLDNNWIKIYDPNGYVNVIMLCGDGCQCSYMGKDTIVYKAKSANLSIIF
jgi:hypothetical protein